MKVGFDRDIDGEVHAAWNPNRPILAVSAPGETRIVDASGGKALTRITHKRKDKDPLPELFGRHLKLRWRGLVEHVGAIAWSPDGGLLAVGTAGGAVQILEATGKKLLSVEHSNPVTSVTWSPDGNLLASRSELGGMIVVVEALTGKELVRLADISALDWSPDGKLLALGSREGIARMLDVRTGQESSLGVHEGKVKAIAWRPDGRQLATGTSHYPAGSHRYGEITHPARW